MRALIDVPTILIWTPAAALVCICAALGLDGAPAHGGELLATAACFSGWWVRRERRAERRREDQLLRLVDLTADVMADDPAAAERLASVIDMPHNGTTESRRGRRAG